MPETEEAEAPPETAPQFTDVLRIDGSFDGFDISYTIPADSFNLSLQIPGVIAELRAIGVSPRPKVAAGAPSGAPASSQNGDGASRGGYGGGQQRNDAPSYDGGGSSFPWKECDHPDSFVKQNGNYGHMECSYSSGQHFPGSKEWTGRNGGAPKYFCTSREPRQGGGGGGGRAWGGRN